MIVADTSVIVYCVTRGEADHLLDFGHEITDDMKQRAEAIQTIEDSTALVPESAEYGDPAPEFWEQSWPEGSAEASAVEFHDAAEPTMDAPLDAGGPIGPF